MTYLESSTGLARASSTPLGTGARREEQNVILFDQTFAHAIRRYPGLPLYEYKCVKCGHRFEKIESLSASEVKKCPECGGRAERQLAPPAIQFKGSGWYVTDYAGKGASSGSDDGAGKSGEKTAEKAEKKADSKTTSTDKSPAKKGK